MKTIVAPADVFSVILKSISEKYRFIKGIVFDPNMDYENTISLDRLNSGRQNFDKSKLPLLSWSRSSFKKTAGSRRHAFNTINLDNSQSLVTFSVVECEFRFTIFTSNMVDLERFETEWYLDQGIREIDHADITIENEKIKYSIVWSDDLDDVVWNLESNYYKALSATAKISGPLLSIEKITEDDDKYKSIIESIYISLLNCNGIDVTENILTPDINSPPDDLTKIDLYNNWKSRQNQHP